MKNAAFIYVSLLVIMLFTTCSKAVILKEHYLSFGGVTLYSNQTYDLIYAEHDVGGVVLNFGRFEFHGDTLILEIDTDEYLNKLTKPVKIECEKAGVHLNFKEYLSPYDETSLMQSYWFGISVKGINHYGDTVSIRKYNSYNNHTDFSRIQLEPSETKGIEKVWVEIFDTPTSKPILLPRQYKCLDITIPVIYGLGSQVSNRQLMHGMDMFVINESKTHYILNAFKRKSKFKITKGEGEWLGEFYQH